MADRDDQDDLLKTPPGFPPPPTPATPHDTSEPTREIPAGPEPSDDLRRRYDLLREVGRGGMGIVYQARDRETDEIVAVKILKPEIAGRSDLLERFKNELRLARKITHKNVCRAHELLRFGQTVAIAMEFVEGESLRSILQRWKGVPPRRGWDWVKQICAALGEAHAQGIVHRDLKPENIMIDRDGQVKVMDFGIARSVDLGTTQTGTVVGTPAYMSPEQAAGRRADPRSDIYSLGLVMYEMFTGRLAFEADTVAGLVQQRLHGTPPPPAEVEPFVPAVFDRAIRKCLERDPAKRFQSVEELVLALEERKASRTEDVPGSIPAHLARPRRADLAFLASGALGLAAFLILAPYVLPESNLRIALSHSAAISRAREELVRRGWTPPLEARSRIETDDAAYSFLAAHVGYGEARRRLTQDLYPISYLVRFGPRPASAQADTVAGIDLDSSGALLMVKLPVPGQLTPTLPTSREDALHVALGALGDAFGVEADQLELDREGPVVVEGRHGHRFSWVRRDPTGLERHYEAEIFQEPVLIRQWVKPPADEKLASSDLTSFYVGSSWVLLGSLALVLFLARRLAYRLSAAEVVVLLALVGVLGALGSTEWWRPLGLLDVFLTLGFGLFLGALLLMISSAVLFLTPRPWPHMVTSYLNLVRLRPTGGMCGLALARGAMLGLGVLGARSVLLALGVLTRTTWSDLDLHVSHLNFFLPLVVLLGWALYAAAARCLGLVFYLSLFRRRTSSPILLGCLGGGIYLALVGVRRPSDWYAMLVTVGVGAAYSLIALRLDLLTVIGAVFTFLLWDDGYALLRMLSPIGNGQYLAVFVLWAGLLAWAFFAAYRSTWRKFGKRLASAFE